MAVVEHRDHDRSLGNLGRLRVDLGRRDVGDEGGLAVDSQRDTVQLSGQIAVHEVGGLPAPRGVGEILAPDGDPGTRSKARQVAGAVGDATGRRRGNRGGSALVDAHVVHQHLLRKLRGGIGSAGPGGGAAHRHVQQDEERMIEDPSGASGEIGGRNGLIKLVIHVEADHPGFPFDSVQVKIVGEALARRERVGRAHPGPAGVVRTVHAAVDDVRLLADVLHDVDLAACGPAHSGDVLPQQPERRPEALSIGNLDARLETAVGLVELVLGENSAGGVLGAQVRLLDGLDDQVAVL